jgi:small subunit ribosomal protein S17
MAEEENKKQQEEQPKAEEKPEEAAEEKPEEAAEEKPEEAAEEPKADEAPAEEAPAGEPAAEEAAAEEGGEEPAAEEAPAADAAGDDEGLDWKARRRLERSRRQAEPRPQQSPDERAATRGEARRVAGRLRSSYRKKRRTKEEAGEGTPPAERRSAGRKTRQGRVVSSKPEKTITVQIEVARRHPQYEKIVRRSRTLHAHDERNEAGEGDLVRLVETRPLSRTKRWRLVEILEKAK